MPIPSKGAASGASSSGIPKSQGIDTRKIIKILYWVTIICAIWFAYLNIQPYARAIKLITQTASGDSALIQLIAAIPIINGIAATIGTALHWFVGFFIWLAIQTVEVFPIILRRDRAFMR
ncbi:MAG: hypothetical protein F6K28_54235, partial [Microcoleus sp. SIO2G3]|nr:hypothetical protein [Microcoleus sp. SIO2G3]